MTIAVVVGLMFMVVSQAVAKPLKEPLHLRPPAVPLVAHDPYFSIWSPADRLTDVTTTHWTGNTNMDVMPTLGIKPPGGCHYPLAGWGEFERLMQPLIERDNYDKAPNVLSLRPTSRRLLMQAPRKMRLHLSLISRLSGKIH